jgi:hypothetical protein
MQFQNENLQLEYVLYQTIACLGGGSGLLSLSCIFAE